MEQAKTVNKIVIEYIDTDIQIKALEKEQATRKEKIVARYSNDLSSKELTTKTHALLIKYSTKANANSLEETKLKRYNELQAIIEQAKAEMKTLEKEMARTQTGFSLTVKELNK